MRVLGMIMAGGKGERLFPLTKERSKPAVPFGGKYRIIDFVLSNFVNSNIFSSYILVQYLSQSLIEYLRTSWNARGIIKDHFLTIVPPQMRLGEIWYRGTADSIRQNISLINDFEPDLVAVFGADHIYRMNIGKMIDFHIKNRADVTVAANVVPLKEASSFGIMAVNDSNRIISFDEKPSVPKPIPGNPKFAYASMGNYIFDKKVLLKVLQQKYCDVPSLDFGKNIIPEALKTHRTFAYDFHSDKLRGIKDYEEQGYWRDVGAIESYWQANMDLLGEKPKFDLNNPLWPINTSVHNTPPTAYMGGKIERSMLSNGCIVYPKTVIKNSVIASNITIMEGSVIEDSIIMDSCTIGKNARVKKAIIDRFNTIPAGASIGIDKASDSQNYFIDSSGIVVIPRGRTKFL
ncbi:MAG: glucose-1-phosphate adenylyltransferase [Elusimicrobiota bacterium]|jgi:glucose-1-phosphate adenylyltransferase|nr:glucose-1-phosphate adenylyltransferase [Elusimicrobiota bacterium]